MTSLVDEIAIGSGEVPQVELYYQVLVDLMSLASRTCILPTKLIEYSTANYLGFIAAALVTS